METISAKTIVTKTKSSEWFGTDYTMNLYRGCSHGCIYCDSRSDCYHIERFDQIRIKENALTIVRDDLRRKVKFGVVGTGAMSDPYNPFEKELTLTRHALELLDAYGFGVAVATKSNLITRDIDLFQSIQENSPVICKITITTLDDDLGKKLEPKVATSSERFEAIQRLSHAGIFAGILLMPILPFINDSEENIIGIIKRAKECGAKFIYPAFGVTLRSGQREYFYQKLAEQFPDQELAKRYEEQFGSSYQCSSPKARKLWGAFAAECQKNGILYEMKDIIHAYKRNYGENQLSLFD